MQSYEKKSDSGQALWLFCQVHCRCPAFGANVHFCNRHPPGGLLLEIETEGERMKLRCKIRLESVARTPFHVHVNNRVAEDSYQVNGHGIVVKVGFRLLYLLAVQLITGKHGAMADAVDDGTKLEREPLHAVELIQYGK